MLEILRSQEQRVRKEREDKEFHRNLRELVSTNYASESVPFLTEMYLQYLKSTEKKTGDKAATAPSEPLKKEPPSAESSKK